MKRTNLTLLWGLLLIVAGILGLVQAFDLIGSQEVWGALWSAVFAAAGLAFLWLFLKDLANMWWAVIPGLTLLALSALILAGLLGIADRNGAWLGGFFLGAIGLSFWIIYFVRRDHWWPIIPGGALLSLGAIAALSTWIEGTVLGSILFFGLAVTFALIAVLPTPNGRLTWAFIPAGVLAMIGLLIAFSFTTAINYVWALLLILVGIYLIYRQSRGGLTRHS
jgi:hypothetical protein